MPTTFDHLDKHQLLDLLLAATDLLPASRRRALIETVPAPPEPPAPTSDTLRQVISGAEDLISFLDEDPQATVTWLTEHWHSHDAFEEELHAYQAELEDSLEAAVAWLATQQPSESLAQQIEDLTESIDGLLEWECELYCGVSYAELGHTPENLEPLQVWSYLLSVTQEAPATIATHLSDAWPNPVGASLLDATLGEQAAPVRTALHERATAGDAAAALWLLLDAPTDPDLLTQFAPLSADLGRRWATSMTAAERWEDIAAGPEHDIEVPADELYRARLHLEHYSDAFRDILDTYHRDTTLAEVWDNAVAAGKLDELRQAARASELSEARWIGLDEPELLAMPEAYAHETIKQIVSYATARATKGTMRSTARSYQLREPLIERLATHPGSHDRDRCVEAALTGLERLMAFHVEARGRYRYARAAAYWGQHGALCSRFGHGNRLLSLRQTFAHELGRLPALMDELNKAGASWR